jgi:mRNA interferase RelE/StbE
MPLYTVKVAKAADRQIDALDGSVRPRVIRAIQALKEEPRPAGCKKLVGADDQWRIRVGAYRVVYTIDDGKLLVLVVRVRHRREVYR